MTRGKLLYFDDDFFDEVEDDVDDLEQEEDTGEELDEEKYWCIRLQIQDATVMTKYKDVFKDEVKRALNYFENRLLTSVEEIDEHPIVRWYLDTGAKDDYEIRDINGKKVYVDGFLKNDDSPIDEGFKLLVYFDKSRIENNPRMLYRFLKSLRSFIHCRVRPHLYPESFAIYGKPVYPYTNWRELAAVEKRCLITFNNLGAKMTHGDFRVSMFKALRCMYPDFQYRDLLRYLNKNVNDVDREAYFTRSPYEDVADIIRFDKLDTNAVPVDLIFKNVYLKEPRSERYGEDITIKCKDFVKSNPLIDSMKDYIQNHGGYLIVIYNRVLKQVRLEVIFDDTLRIQSDDKEYVIIGGSDTFNSIKQWSDKEPRSWRSADNVINICNALAGKNSGYDFFKTKLMSVFK